MTFASTEQLTLDPVGVSTEQPRSGQPPKADAPPSSEAALLMPYQDYVAYRPNIFPSPTSGEWFLRRHRAALKESGALLLLSGRILVHPQLFDAYVLQVGRRMIQTSGA